MTIFDLLFIGLALCAAASLVVAAALAIRGRFARSGATLTRLVACAAAYVGIVYGVTAASRPVILHPGDPQCSDDWCIAVEHVERTPKSSSVAFDVTLRIFSRARRVSQREMSAKDVYLVDASWRRYDPLPHPAEAPLNTLLQPEQSLLTRRTFELPPGARGVGLIVDHGSPPFCLIIGECGAFHRDPLVQLDASTAGPRGAQTFGSVARKKARTGVPTAAARCEIPESFPTKIRA